MTAFASLVGRTLTGVVPLGPKAMALAFDGTPRAFLWILLEPKRAAVTLDERMPISPDARGTPFGGLERPLRGLRVAAIDVREGSPGVVDISLISPERAEEDGPASGEPTHRLTLAAEGPRITFGFRLVDDDRVLWALDRKDPPAATGARAPEASDPEKRPPRPARLEVVRDDEAREALRADIDHAFQEDFRRELDRMTREAVRMLERRERALEGDKKAAEDHLLDRRRGEILLSYFADIQRGASHVELPDPYADSPGARIRLVLDPALSPHDNAARLFQRARKGERGLALVERRLTQTRKSLAEAAELRRAVYGMPPKEALTSLDAFFREAALDLSARGERRGSRLLRRSSAPPRAERPERRSPGAHRSIRPRTFATRDGWAVWVGRNNTENDLITHRLSQPHDFWFHVVGVPGSHVILRRPTRTAVPTPRTLEEAASIAAYFSKARKLTRVPVIYTERKFVSKPRRAKPGQALATRERELLVRPRKPEGGKAGSDDDREVSS
jgi:hypothetical protein